MGLITFLIYNNISFNHAKNPGYYVFPIKTCKGDIYWYDIAWAKYPTGDLAFLLIEKTKLDNLMLSYNHYYILTNYITGEKLRVADFKVNEKIKIPNDKFLLYESYTNNSGKRVITNKSKRDIPISIIESFFQSKRSNYDLADLIKYYDDYLRQMEKLEKKHSGVGEHRVPVGEHQVPGQKNPPPHRGQTPTTSGSDPIKTNKTSTNKTPIATRVKL